MLMIDPIEEKTEYKSIFETVNQETEEILNRQGIKCGIGYIHKFDALKQQILLEKYNIMWRTTSEMNPDVRID